MINFSDIDLYPVTGRSHFIDKMADEEVIKALADGGAKIVQLREKDISSREYFELAKLYRRETTLNNMLFIVNDRPDIAMATNADGVHLGDDDFPVAEARKLMGPDAIIGASAHSASQAVEAEKNGASYVNIGPIFSTPTKPDAKGIGLLPLSETLAAVNIPVTVMGGIDLKNIDQILSAGARHIGVVTALFKGENIGDNVRLLISRIRQNSQTWLDVKQRM